MFEWLTVDFLYKFIRFGIVGASGIIVDFGVTALCKDVFKIQKFVSNGIGFTMAATSNYILNRFWTFQSTNPEVFLEFIKFFSVSLIGLAINTLVLYFTLKKFKWNFYFAKIIAIGVTMIWNFVANLLFTFI